MPRSRRVAKIITDGKIKGIITQAKNPELLRPENRDLNQVVRSLLV